MRNHSGRSVVGAEVAIAHVERARLYFGGCGELVTMVENAGEAAADADTPRFARNAQTASDGRFVLEGLTEGAYDVIICHEREGVCLRKAVSPAADPLEFVLDPPTFLEGRLRGLLLDPQRDHVDLEAAGPWDRIDISIRLTLDKDGRFRAGPLPSLKDWSLVASSFVMERAYTATRFRSPIELKPGVNRLDLDASAGRRLAGKVVGPKNEPLSNVSIVARDKTALGEERGAVSDAHGLFVLTGLRDGEYNMDINRWLLRATPGCGPGARDIAAVRSFRIPVLLPEPAIIRIPSFYPGVEVNDPAPDFVARLLDGTPVKLGDFRGKLVLLDFWATWCGMCQAKMPTLARLHDELGRKGELIILGVSVDKDPARARSYIGRHHLAWRQTALGPIDANPIARQYNVNSTPTMFLISRDGRVLAKEVPVENLDDFVRKAAHAGK